MSVKKIGPKNWAARACWVDPEGKQHQPYKSGFATKAAALAWEQEQIEQGQGLTHTASADLATVRQLHNEYISRLERLGRSPSTVDFFERKARHWLPDYGERRLTTMAPADIQEIVNRDVDAGLSAATVRGTYRAIRAEFKLAENLDVIAKTPCRGIELPALSAHEATICTPEELQLLIGLLRDQWHPLYIPVTLCVMNALRRGEAAGLRWQDVDLEAGTAEIRGTLITMKGGGAYKRAKTASSMDQVALPDFLVEDLRTMRQQRLEAGCYRIGSIDVSGVTRIADLDPAEFVCLNERDGVFRPDGLVGRLHSFQRAHDLRVTGWHDLRHTYGTLMAEAGVDLATISKAMRHSQTNITSTMYISNTTGIKRRATDAMGQIVQLFPSRQPDADAKNH